MLSRRNFPGLSLAVMALVVGNNRNRPGARPTTATRSDWTGHVMPTVSATSPVDGATGVAIMTASFSEAMNASTMSATTFTVDGPGPTAGSP